MRRFLALFVLISSAAFAQPYGPQSSVFLGGTVPNATTFNATTRFGSGSGVYDISQTSTGDFRFTLGAAGSTLIFRDSVGSNMMQMSTAGGVTLASANGMTIGPGTFLKLLTTGRTTTPAIQTEGGTITLASTPTKLVSLGANLTGTYTGNNTGALVSIGSASDNASLQLGHYPSLSVTRQFGGPGTAGGRFSGNFDLIMTSDTSDTTGSAWESLNVNGELRGNAGGNAATPLGALYSLVVYARAESGATHIVEVAGQEVDMSIEAGASVQNMHGISVISLDVNTVVPGAEYTGFAVAAQTGASTTMTCAFCVGRIDGFSPLASTGTVLDLLPNGYRGVIPSVGNGVDFRLGTFATAAFETSGASLNGSTLRVGRTFLTDSSTGLTITPTGSVGVSATVTAGGSGYVGPYSVNAHDSNGGIWQLTITGDAVTAVTMLSAPYASGAPPSNPVTLINALGQPGTGATITITWAAGTSTTLAGAIIASGLPTSAPATHCAIWANAGVLTLTTCP